MAARLSTLSQWLREQVQMGAAFAVGEASGLIPVDAGACARFAKLSQEVGLVALFDIRTLPTVQREQFYTVTGRESCGLPGCSFVLDSTSGTAHSDSRWAYDSWTVGIASLAGREFISEMV